MVPSLDGDLSPSPYGFLHVSVKTVSKSSNILSEWTGHIRPLFLDGDFSQSPEPWWFQVLWWVLGYSGILLAFLVISVNLTGVKNSSCDYPAPSRKLWEQSESLILGLEPEMRRVSVIFLSIRGGGSLPRRRQLKALGLSGWVCIYLSVLQDFRLIWRYFAGWWFGCHQFYFPIYWVANHPNWLTHIFQRGGYTTTNQFWDWWVEESKLCPRFFGLRPYPSDWTPRTFQNPRFNRPVGLAPGKSGEDDNVDVERTQLVVQLLQQATYAFEGWVSLEDSWGWPAWRVYERFNLWFGLADSSRV